MLSLRTVNHTDLRAVIEAIRTNGFREVRQRGTHRQYSNGRITVTVPMKDGNKIGRGIARKILKQAGYT